jgi:hypothetical protein
MAREVYDSMVRLLVARRGIDQDDTQAVNNLLAGRSFNHFWGKVSSTLLIKPTTDDPKVFVANRVAAWQALVAKDFRGATPRFTDTMAGDKTPLAKRFRVLATEVPDWYSGDYNHHVLWGNWRAVPRQPSAWSTFWDSLKCSWRSRNATPQKPQPQTQPQPQPQPQNWKSHSFPRYGEPKW